MSTVLAEAGPSTSLAGPSSPRAAPYEPRAPLVNQLDADSLDDGIAALLSDGVERAVSRLRPPSAPDLKPEITLVLKLFIFAVGVFSPRTASPGAALQNLRLCSARGGRPSRNTLLLYLALHPPLLPTYLLTRARITALSRQWPDLPAHDIRRKAWNLLVRVENAARAWELLGWGLFLWDRRYPSLLMRILGLRLVPSSAHLARMVSYEFMNRQLVWGVMTEFLMFAVPRMPALPRFANPANLVAPVKQFFSPTPQIDYAALSAAQEATHTARRTGAPIPVAAHAGVLAGIARQTCPVCYLRRTSTPVALSGTDIALPPLSAEDTAAGDETDNEDRIFVPAQTDCWGSCRYCYYCVAEELARHAEEAGGGGARAGGGAGGGAGAGAGSGAGSGNKWTCLRCGGNVTRAKRVGAEPGALKPIPEVGSSEEDDRMTSSAATSSEGDEATSSEDEARASP